MDKSRLERFSPLSGIVAVAFMLIGVLVFNNYEFLPPAEEAADFLNSTPAAVYAGGYIASLSAFFLIWFAGSVRSALTDRGSSQLAAIAFGGGVAAAIVLGISFVGILTAGLRAGAPGGITPVGAITMFDYWTQLTGQLFAMFLAVLIGAAAAVSLRTRIFPAWFDWLSLVVVAGLLTPFAYVMLAFAILWILVVSLWLTFNRSAYQDSAAAAQPV
jgi:hypothetical protein